MKFIYIFACLVAMASGRFVDSDDYTVDMTVDQDFVHLMLRHIWQPLRVKELLKYTDMLVVDETKYVVSDFLCFFSLQNFQF